MAGKVVKNKTFGEHVYWVLYKYHERVEMKDGFNNALYDDNHEKLYTVREDKGWTFITAPAMILSHHQLLSVQAQIAKEGKFDKCLIEDFKLVISR